ncbi:hypothetical protein Entcl_2165 [[Enterobacter] lignolyticus SCF1]|uniref:Uncharacterized protein n=1 Tax=Enterobacter lignolyticus (strain SCF1) TaxID=701347 RepID=E3G638_ENTLS|nr:hypothetical protein Entcl_2165 [[Enterobacter] lignolyticus SCF1]
MTTYSVCIFHIIDERITYRYGEVKNTQADKNKDKVNTDYISSVQSK